MILAKDKSGWGYATHKGREGWIPISFVRDLPELPSPPKTDEGPLPPRVLRDTKVCRH